MIGGFYVGTGRLLGVLALCEFSLVCCLFTLVLRGDLFYDCVLAVVGWLLCASCL